MLDAPIESTYVWVGLAVVSAATLGLALRVPTGPPPDATTAARTVDSVSSSPYEASGRHPIDADGIRLGSERIGLRTDGGAAHASFAFDSVVPALGSDRLAVVLSGRPPRAVFASPETFAAALENAESYESRWQPAPETLLVRRVSWGNANATLVGA